MDHEGVDVFVKVEIGRTFAQKINSYICDKDEDMTMTKSELVKVVMLHSELKRNEACDFVEDFFEVISRSLEKGEEVKVPGFGNFLLRDKKARMGRNPKTKQEYLIEARRVVSFRASNKLKAAINVLKRKNERRIIE